MTGSLEQGAFCKGMSWLATNDAWPRQTRLFVRGQGVDHNIDSLDGKTSSMVIFIKLDGVKAMIERIKG